MCKKEKQQISILYFSLTRQELEPMIYSTQGEHANHYEYPPLHHRQVIEAVTLNWTWKSTKKQMSHPDYTWNAVQFFFFLVWISSDGEWDEWKAMRSSQSRYDNVILSPLVLRCTSWLMVTLSYLIEWSQRCSCFYTTSPGQGQGRAGEIWLLFGIWNCWIREENICQGPGIYY